ncbi:hypothetical protein Strvi_9519 (plasmid) [Streptomyces violaceusniger Tu 4113]|uniref:Uncharacterized protein n=1 Tax=Streptomyces violaceusniger (strain Tu 4113) TaxID=653045 RepID=G2PHC1_STRV4|nr:hypothetical protein Strvi_9519 [Streptomyces violaceusniger Tu 4113]
MSVLDTGPDLSVGRDSGDASVGGRRGDLAYGLGAIDLNHFFAPEASRETLIVALSVVCEEVDGPAGGVRSLGPSLLVVLPRSVKERCNCVPVRPYG